MRMHDDFRPAERPGSKGALGLPGPAPCRGHWSLTGHAPGGGVRFGPGRCGSRPGLSSRLEGSGSRARRARLFPGKMAERGPRRMERPARFRPLLPAPGRSRLSFPPARNSGCPAPALLYRKPGPAAGSGRRRGRLAGLHHGRPCRDRLFRPRPFPRRGDGDLRAGQGH